VSAKSKPRATYEDLFRIPEHETGEIVDGELYTHPRPAVRHARALFRLGSILGDPFDRGRNGPGGWVILAEPELHLAEDIVAPDIAGWRRARMPELPDAAFIAVAPDWVCEGLSPRTERVDRGKKMTLYARERVGHVWLVNVAQRMLEIFELDGATFRLLHVAEGDERGRFAPFDELEIDRAELWAS
jgi:Uma2 family endonuclease